MATDLDRDSADGGHATRALWDFLGRPFTSEEAAQCLTGMPPALTRQVVAVTVASSPEAAALLAAMPRVLRSLAVITHDSPVRCIGEVRGPLLWSETVAARAGTAGRTDVFVCSSPTRAYDTPENRVLAFALDSIVHAVRTGSGLAKLMGGPERASHLRMIGSEARRHLEHRTLSGVRRERPDARAVARTRNGPRSRTYRTALAVLDRIHEPLGIGDLLPFVDPRTSRQHDVLLALAERLHEHGRPLVEPTPTPWGHLEMGPVIYRHPSVAGTHQPTGIVGGRLVVDVPDPVDHPDVEKAAADLARWNGGWKTALVSDEASLERAAERLSAELDGAG